MAASVNKVILVGNLGKDPEIRRLENDVVVASFSMATTETYIDKQTGEKRDQTEWHNIALWRGLAEIAERYLQKGSKVYVEGKLRTRSWNAQDGTTRYTTEVVGENIVLLTPPPQRSEGEVKPPYPTQASPVLNPLPPSFNKEDVEDDLPF